VEHVKVNVRLALSPLAMENMKLMQIPVLIAEHAQAAAPQALLSRADFYIGTA